VPPNRTTTEPDDTEEGWQEVTLEGGDKIDWSKTPEIEGTFLAKRIVDTDEDQLLMLIFDEKKAGRVFTWAGPKLREAFTDILPGSRVRVSYVGDKEVNRPSPMRMFKVMVRVGPGSYTGPGAEDEPF